jgi:hypothetical protein
MNPQLHTQPALNGCHPDRREACPPRRGSAFSSLFTRRSLLFPLHFLSFTAPFPVLVLFVFNSLRTLLHLRGRGGIGRGPLSRINTQIRQPFLLVAPSIWSMSFRFTFLQTLLLFHKTQLLSFHAIPNSFAKTPGVGERVLHSGSTRELLAEGNSMRPIDFAPQLSANRWSQKILPHGHLRP